MSKKEAPILETTIQLESILGRIPYPCLKPPIKSMTESIWEPFGACKVNACRAYRRAEVTLTRQNIVGQAI
ncbi:hypothetical protein PARA125_001904 [Parachlamydia sp. AcF125]|nr:hypothetical protein [Parachlamydia sp. AcF125]